MKHILLLAAMSGLTCLTNADVISFSDLEVGDVIAEQYASIGVHISTISPGNSSSQAFVMNTQSGEHDLEDPFEVGNIALDTQFGNSLLFQHGDFESASEEDNSHNDHQSAQQLVFDFDSQAQNFGFVVMGFDDDLGEHDSVDFYRSGSLVLSVDFEEFESGGLFDMNANFDGRSLNLIGGINIDGGFDRVVMNIGDSIGLDNVSFNSVPAPGSILVLGLGAGLGLRRRR